MLCYIQQSRQLPRLPKASPNVWSEKSSQTSTLTYKRISGICLCVPVCVCVYDIHACVCVCLRACKKWGVKNGWGPLAGGHYWLFKQQRLVVEERERKRHGEADKDRKRERHTRPEVSHFQGVTMPLEERGRWLLLGDSIKRHADDGPQGPKTSMGSSNPH